MDPGVAEEEHQQPRRRERGHDEHDDEGEEHPDHGPSLPHDGASADGATSSEVATEDDARRIALSLPETTEKPSYGTPGFRVKDKLFARIHDLPDTLVVWVPDMDEKEALLASSPEKFFETPHYDGYPMVLVRLAPIDSSELTEVITDSWRARAPRRLLADFDG